MAQTYEERQSLAAWNALESAVAAGVKIATGTYTGTGEAGPETPTSLHFDFSPKVVWVYDNGYARTTFYPKSQYARNTLDNSDLAVTFNGGDLSWYHLGNNSSQSQLCLSNKTYYWIAIG